MVAAREGFGGPEPTKWPCTSLMDLRPRNDNLCYISVRPGENDQFVAQALGFPDLKAEGPTEQDAIDKVRRSLMEFLATTKIVKVTTKADNPWLKAFGHAAADPDFEEYLEDIRKARAQEG